jgi:hypothetical protein
MSMGGLLTALRIISLIIIVIGYYLWIVAKMRGLVRLSAVMDRLQQKFPARHVEAAYNLAYAGGLQALFCIIITVLYAPHLIATASFFPDPALLVFGIVLGVGEMGLTTLLGYAAITIIDSFERRRVTTNQFSASRPGWIQARTPSTSTARWSTTARGGWMQYYIQAIAILPRNMAVAFVLLYVFFEEFVFRGVILATLTPLGAAGSVAVSTLLFVLVQTFHMPGWRTSLFPAIGAIVVGIVHGGLFVKDPNILPLAVAHASFFFTAMWSIRRIDSTPQMSAFG